MVKHHLRECVGVAIACAGSGVLSMRTPLVIFMMFSGWAHAYDRCYIEAAPRGNSTCFIAMMATTLFCTGQDKRRTAQCATAAGDPVACELRVTRLGEPPDIWCAISPPPPSDSAVATLMASGDRYRNAPRNAPAKPPAPTETCVLPIDQSKWSYATEYNMYVRCLKRKTLIERRVPYEDCDALVTSDPSTFSALIQQKRRQDCLDRQAVGKSLGVGQRNE